MEIWSTIIFLIFAVLHSIFMENQQNDNKEVTAKSKFLNNSDRMVPISLLSLTTNDKRFQDQRESNIPLSNVP